jgi:putative peptidoglycan lipid II flippase
MSRLTRNSLMLAFFLLTDKGLAIVRQLIIARQFTFSKELDAFNVANNIPDLLFALISGGALAMAFIPVLTEVLTKRGQGDSWELFSRIANLAFLVTALLAVVVGVLADPLVRSPQFGIAPGFDEAQKQVVVSLMRWNLVATLIFSISGLIMAGLQANQHFFLPALAPILYNVGQIFGALVLSPSEGYVILGVRLPALGLGVHGLVYGVILGAVLHLAIQIPGLRRYNFRWIPQVGLNTPLVRQVLRVMGPRLVTMLFVQLTFIWRDHLASYLPTGSVSSLTYGWMIMQVPETVIGTAIGIAILPTLSELIAKGAWDEFKASIERAVRVLVALTIPVAVVLIFGLRPLLALAFKLDSVTTDLLLWTSRAFLVGLTGQCLMEIAIRSFYSRQEAVPPLITAGINLGVYVLISSLLYQPLGAPGIGLADALAFTSQALLLLFLLNRRLTTKVTPGGSLFRAMAAGIAAGIAAWLVISISGERLAGLLGSVAGMALGAAVAVPIVWRELRVLVRL